MESHVYEDGSVQINISFTKDSSARGAQVIFSPHNLNKTTCTNLAVHNIQKSGDQNMATVTARDILRGTYNLNVYTLNHNGVPDSRARPVNSPMEISISRHQGKRGQL